MAANLATVAALLLIMVAAPILEASGSEQAADTARPGLLARTRTRAPPPGVRVRCTEVHVAKAGETCDSVARAAGFSGTSTIRNLNPNITCPVVFPGQSICVAGSAIA